MVEQAVKEFGGVDIVVNNASAINLHPTKDLPLKRLDLMLDINIRGTFALTQAALPYLWESDHAHVLTLSPPVNLEEWIGCYPAYAVGKFGMSVLALGWAKEFGGRISSNCLWPETTIATAAVKNNADLGGDDTVRHSGSGDHGGRRSRRPRHGAGGGERSHPCRRGRPPVRGRGGLVRLRRRRAAGDRPVPLVRLLLSTSPCRGGVGGVRR